jgi:alpha-tubulin suppressor-like RCC1 family protein
VGFGQSRFDASMREGPYVKLSAGSTFTAALTPDGALVAWGSEEYGQA